MAGFLEDFVHSMMYMPVGMVCYASYKFMFSEAVIWRKVLGAGVWSVPIGYAVSQTGFHALSYFIAGISGAFIVLFLVGIRKIMDKWADDPLKVIREIKGTKK